MGVELGLALGALSAGTGIVSTIQSRKAAKAQQRIAEQRLNLERQQIAANAARSRRKQVRQSRIARASAIARGSASGGLESSGLEGGLGSLQSRTAQNVAFTEQGVQRFNNSADNIFALGRQASSAAGSAALFGGISSLSGQGFSALGGPEAITDFFRGGGSDETTTNVPTGMKLSRRLGGS